MDHELEQLEAELKKLRPAAPSRDLNSRIEADLTASAVAARRELAPRRTRAWWLWTAALPAAAALAVAAVVLARRPPTPAPTVSIATPASATVPIAYAEAALFKPVSAENILYAVSDEGLVTLEDGTAGRRERLNYVDTITWKHPRTNASVRWTMPREEVRVVPVKFQ